MKIKTFFMESWNYGGPWALHLLCRMEKSALAFRLWINFLNVSSNQAPSHWSSSATSGIFAQIHSFSWNSPPALLPLRATELPYNTAHCALHPVSDLASPGCDPRVYPFLTAHRRCWCGRSQLLPGPHFKNSSLPGQLGYQSLWEAFSDLLLPHMLPRD